MENEIKSITNKVDGKEVRVTVEKIENGFLITENSEWKDPKKGYMYETKKRYSETNPLKGIKI